MVYSAFLLHRSLEDSAFGIKQRAKLPSPVSGVIKLHLAV
uniref:Uncharacterized protein n=1 Tax=Anguilla anguilla TaxID=7936 RepID=A0A0E9T3F3_ANGAN